MHPPPFTFAFDFDSTLVSVETFDELLVLSLAAETDLRKRERIVADFRKITDAGMNGEIPVKESFARRLAAARLHRRHLDQFIEGIAAHITPGIAAMIADLQGRGHRVMVLSGGITEAILPVADMLGIARSDIHANTPRFDADGWMLAYEDHPLVETHGKSLVLAELKRLGTVGTAVMIGDGSTDALAWQHGGADHFAGFGMHAVRPAVQQATPHFFTDVPSLQNHLLSLLP